LTHFINSAEWNLASAVSNSPAIHFILYIPPQKTSPLLVVRSDGIALNLIIGSLLPSNAFLIPQWGGIVIENFPKTNGRKHLSTSDLHPIIETFTQQLLTLLGVVPVEIDDKLFALAIKADLFQVTIKSDTQHGLTGWELDGLLRRSAVQNIADTVSTLKSLSSMLQALKTIAVQDNITILVNRAIHSMKTVY
jgi:phosphatidylinositol glycan class S